MIENIGSTQLVLREGIIELSWGQPDSALLPAEDLRRAAELVLARSGGDALAYGANAGPAALLTWLRRRIERVEGRAVAPEEIVTTGGNSDALDQICTLCTRPGDVVLVESPTYHLAVRILRDHPLELVPVAVDQDGLRVDAVAEQIAALRREGKRARLLYTVPTFHNPSGVSLSLERRKALVDLAVAEDLLIVEDDVYRELAYDAPAAPSLWSLAPVGTVARMGSFSKVLAPGLRVGWVTGAAELAQRFVDCGLRDSGGGPNHFTAMVVSAFCELGLFDAHVESLREAYRSRRDALLGSLREHLSAGATVIPPGGGFFVWVTLPEGIDSAAMLPIAEKAGVTYIPGGRFHWQGGGGNTMRLAFSLFGPEELAEAGRRLGEVLRQG